MSGFKITRRQGFHVSFDNGWTVSVQFGPYNYCSARDMSESGAAQLIRTAYDMEAIDAASDTAEVAAWDANEEWLQFEDDTVKGWQSPADVLALLQYVASLPPSPDPPEAHTP